MTGEPARRAVMRSAVAAGGASAVLMSSAVTCNSEAGIAAAAEQCLEPLLRAVLAAIEAAAGAPGDEQRAALADIVTDFLSPTALQPELAS